MAEQHRNRPGLAGHRMLDRQLGRLHRGDRLLRLHHLLGDAAEGSPRVPAAVIAGRLLIRRVQAEARGIAEIGEEQHGRPRQMRLERANEAVAQDPRALAQEDARTPGQPAIDLGHDAAQRLLAHRHHAHLVLHLAQARDDAAGMPARYAEDVFDAGFRQHPRDQHTRRQFLGQHPFDRHLKSPPKTASACLATQPERNASVPQKVPKISRIAAVTDAPSRYAPVRR
jgi:hypothetical protein